MKEIAVNVSWKATPSTYLDGGSHIYDRDKDKQAIIKLLFEDSRVVIPILGTCGVEKLICPHWCIIMRI